MNLKQGLIVSVASISLFFLSGCAGVSGEPQSSKINVTTEQSPETVSPMGYELNNNNEIAEYPLGNFSTYEIVSYVNDNTAHNGIDIIAPAGTEVFSIGSGTVRSVGNKNFYGYRLLIDYVYDDALISITYGHLDPNNSLKPGDKVNQGALIGKVGEVQSDSPYATSRLHFGVEQNYVQLDPELWLGQHLSK